MEPVSHAVFGVLSLLFVLFAIFVLGLFFKYQLRGHWIQLRDSCRRAFHFFHTAKHYRKLHNDPRVAGKAIAHVLYFKPYGPFFGQKAEVGYAFIAWNGITYNSVLTLEKKFWHLADKGQFPCAYSHDEPEISVLDNPMLAMKVQLQAFVACIMLPVLVAIVGALYLWNPQEFMDTLSHMHGFL